MPGITQHGSIHNKNKKTLKMKNDVGMACQKVSKQGRDDSIKVKVSV